MDDFEVRAKSTDILSSSLLIEELSAQAQEHTSFPVIIDGFVRTFHDVRGGYDANTDSHVVKLVQKRDNMASSDKNFRIGVYELHLNDSFLLYANDFYVFETNESLQLCLDVNQYDQQEYSFREQLTPSHVEPEPNGYNWVDQ